MRRIFLKFLGFSLISSLLIPLSSILAATKTLFNKDLTDEQKDIMFNEGTERPFSSELNKENRKGFYHCAKCGVHHGHVFNDGPSKNGKRFCNNGLCLIFKPSN